MLQQVIEADKARMDVPATNIATARVTSVVAFDPTVASVHPTQVQ